MYKTSARGRRLICCLSYFVYVYRKRECMCVSYTIIYVNVTQNDRRSGYCQRLIQSNRRARWFANFHIFIVALCRVRQQRRDYWRRKKAIKEKKIISALPNASETHFTVNIDALYMWHECTYIYVYIRTVNSFGSRDRKQVHDKFIYQRDIAHDGLIVKSIAKYLFPTMFCTLTALISHTVFRCKMRLQRSRKLNQLRIQVL